MTLALTTFLLAFPALFSIVNPPGAAFIFNEVTAHLGRAERLALSNRVALYSLGVMLGALWGGAYVLEFFGISLPAFRIAGGVILFLMGLEMARDDFSAKFSAPVDGESGTGRAFVRMRFERMIVPFAMPLLIGPGAISTVIIYASQAREFGLQGAAVGVGVISAVALATLLSFLATPILTRILGRIGLTVVVRVLGLILCALAIQFILAGLAESTLGFIRPGVAHPY